MSSAYSPRVAELFATTPHLGPLRGEAGPVFAGEAGRRELGAQVRFEARIEAGTITAIAFQAYGCPHCIAACALAADELSGAPAAMLCGYDWRQLADALEVPAGKAGRLLLIQDALQHCCEAWENSRLAGQ